MRRASSAAALIEQDDPIDAGIKVPPPACGAAGTRSAMKDERGLAGGIAARLPIDLVPVTGIKHPVIVGFNIWIRPGMIAPYGFRQRYENTENTGGLRCYSSKIRLVPSKCKG